MLGRIGSQPALLIAERAAFAVDTPHLAGFALTLTGIRNLGANDIYNWYLASSKTAQAANGGDGEPPSAAAAAAATVATTGTIATNATTSTTSASVSAVHGDEKNSNADDATTTATTQPPDLKINLIYPCTEKHIRKYSRQGLRSVRETPDIYEKHVRPYMALMREHGRLNWVYNIIEGRTEQEDVIHREHGEEGFLLLPDL
jgi:m7GpppX diphosphatase